MEKTLSERELFDVIRTKVQAGYDVVNSDGEAACSYWLEAWKAVQQIFDRTKMKKLDEFEHRFKWSHFLSNWLQDLEQELWNAGLDNRNLLLERIAFCEGMLERFPAAKSPDLGTENLRRSLAETYFELGECEKSEILFSGWLKEDPKWGWGWIGWSDLFFFSKDKKNVDKCEKILREGLAIPEVRDHFDILERLSDIYDSQGKQKESKELRNQADNERRQANSFSASKYEIPPGDVSTTDFAALMRELSNPPAIAKPKRSDATMLVHAAVKRLTRSAASRKY